MGVRTENAVIAAQTGSELAVEMANRLRSDIPVDLDGDLAGMSSVSKALSLLGAFSADRPTLGVTDLARRAGLPKSTAFRLLAILADWGAVRRVGSKYELGDRLSELAAIVPYSTRQQLRDVALPFLEDLYELTHQIVHLALLDGTDIVYIEKIHGHNAIRTPTRVGGRMNAECTALGKAILAFSDEDATMRVARHLRPLTKHSILVPGLFLGQLATVRENGIAYSNEEAALGLVCVAAPILGPEGDVVAAISVSGSSSRFSPHGATVVVRKTAAGVASAWARRSPP